jgi:hypothetical protein
LKDIVLLDLSASLFALEAITADQTTLNAREVWPKMSGKDPTRPEAPFSPEESRINTARAALKSAQDGRVILDQTNSFLEMLAAKLEETNVGDDIISHLRDHHSGLFIDYDSGDADDIAILNNKVHYVASLYGDRPSDAPPLEPKDYKKVLRIFQSRH